MSEQTKTCQRCHQVLPVESFFRRRSGSRLYQGYCKRCQARLVNERYHNNPTYRESQLRYFAQRRKRLSRSLRERIREFFGAHPCVDCGATDPCILTFDHVRGSKLCNVSKLVAKIQPWSLVSAEMNKCVVRCFNCHMKKTRSERKWGMTSDPIARARKKLLGDYKQEVGCLDCAEHDPDKLVFDHVNGNKIMDVGRLVNGGYGWQTIMREVSKCVVRCYNCHMRRHHGSSSTVQ
jgi:hypothetical protein